MPKTFKETAVVELPNWAIRELHKLGVHGFIAAHPGMVELALTQVQSQTNIPITSGIRLRATDRGPKRFVYEVVAISADGKVVLSRYAGPWTHPDKPIGSFKMVDAAELRDQIKSGQMVPTV